MLFYETYFEEININPKPLIWSHDKRVMKVGPKKLVSLVFGKVYENILKIKEKCYIKENNISQKPLIWCRDKIVNLDQKNG